MSTCPTIKTLVLPLVMLLTGHVLYGQSFVAGEPRGVLNRLLTHYIQTEQICDDIILDVELKHSGDTAIFCIGQFKDATDIFLCLPGAVYKKGGNYIFVKNGFENYFSFSEAYIKFIYEIAAKYTGLNLMIESFDPLEIECTDDVLELISDDGDYTWYWYYVVNFNILKVIKNKTSLYSTCGYGGE